MKSPVLSRRALVIAAAALAALAVTPAAGASPADPALANHWPLDETQGATAADVVAGRQLGLLGGASFTGGALNFDGVGGQALGDHVDIATDQSFSVSAWVRLSAKNFGEVTAVSVDGDRTSKFRLGHIVDDDNNQFGAWSFQGPESDTDNAQVTKVAVTIFPTEVGQWAHLVGVYDAAAQRVRIYLDGTLSGEGTLTTPWNAGGGLRIGAAKTAGQADKFWPGDVDDVRLYQGALTHTQVSELYRAYHPA
ncbi:Concanavalin A-like lectin/glucanases superfamily protein [Amycolatopsis xylanica]|uniref:Concanavalin A-like lectin/glucanases superfamily protein n=1 Tax=Amycolatopsis xylanica TaxID=589385 RepID=A0A1H3IXQ3_9PSEU|nr:LamG domain-containing protein [Amycolatopsis xylanica]SDY32506.1 Concanavalin A-like lectin/glucanases superfamily protein [Amycolatopsis xylanica]